jgi:hypothetical protein
MAMLTLPNNGDFDPILEKDEPNPDLVTTDGTKEESPSKLKSKESHEVGNLKRISSDKALKMSKGGKPNLNGKHPNLSKNGNTVGSNGDKASTNIKNINFGI